MPKLSKRWLAAISLVAVLLTLSAVFYAKQYRQKHLDDDKGQVPAFSDCPNTKQLFMESPVALKDLSTIIPMGNFAPPGHIGATPHMYYNFLNVGKPDAPNPARTSIVAPGAMTITRITKFDNASSAHPFDSYRLDFTFCREVSGYFIHIVELSNKLADIMKPPYDTTQESKVSGEITEHTYAKNVNIPMLGGEPVGFSGGGTDKPAGLDFGLVDEREPVPTLANPARWKNDSHYVCSLDYFPSQLSQELYKKIGDYTYKVREPGEPKCGTIYQDLPGTAQGLWFTRDVPSDMLGDPAMEINLAHSNLDHGLGIFSLGNKLESIGIDTKSYYVFSPKSEGLVDVDFKYVKPNGNIYCYQLKNQYNYSLPDTALLIQMTDATTLRVGKNPANNCKGGPWKIDPFVEYVR